MIVITSHVSNNALIVVRDFAIEIRQTQIILILVKDFAIEIRQPKLS